MLLKEKERYKEGQKRQEDEEEDVSRYWMTLENEREKSLRKKRLWICCKTEHGMMNEFRYIKIYKVYEYIYIPAGRTRQCVSYDIP